MGRPIVDRLVLAGYSPVVLARRPEARVEGLTCYDTVADVVRGAVVSCAVFSEEQVLDAVGAALPLMRAGSVLVQHTTCDPAVLTRLAGAGAAHGVTVLDAALSGTPSDIVSGALTLWVGGDPDVLERVRPLLDAYASPVLAVGPVGNGQRLKLVNNALFVAQVGLALDASRLAAALGLPESLVLPALTHGSGASRALGVVSGMGVDAVPGRLAALMSKDVDVLARVAVRSGASLGLLGDVLGSDAVRESVLSDA